MPTMTGSFSGSAGVQSSILAPDRPNHMLSLVEVRGVQRCSDENWNNDAITYWGFTDILDGQGTQSGCFSTDHGNRGRDWGTFEGKVTTLGGQLIVEGTWQFTGGTGQFTGLTGGGTFKTKAISPTEVEASWQGAYELAGARAAGA